MSDNFCGQVMAFRLHGEPIAEWMEIPFVSVPLEKIFKVDCCIDKIGNHDECHPAPRWKEEHILPKLLHFSPLGHLSRRLRHGELRSHVNMHTALASSGGDDEEVLFGDFAVDDADRLFEGNTVFRTDSSLIRPQELPSHDQARCTPGEALTDSASAFQCNRRAHLSTQIKTPPDEELQAHTAPEAVL